MIDVSDQIPRKPLSWVGSAYDDLCNFPEDARRLAGSELNRVQKGMQPLDWKPLAIVGQGVNEIRVRTKTEHRVIYVARFPEAVYV